MKGEEEKNVEILINSRLQDYRDSMLSAFKLLLDKKNIG